MSRDPSPPWIAEARDLDYRYPDGSPALRGFSLGVRGGETLGLLGPNGSGKSTFLRLLAAARATPAAGGIGIAVTSWLAPDEPVFRDWLSGRENAVALLELSGRGMSAAAALAADWLVRFDLEGEADRSVGAYSRGMRRRLALAIAFAAAPGLVLLDEPLAGLDPGGRAILAGALHDHGAGGGASILSTHEPGFAAAHCDRVALLDQGRCPAVDTPAGLLSRVGAETRIEVRFAEGRGPRPGSLERLPDEVGAAENVGDAVVLTVAEPRAALPAALAWLLDGGCEIVSVDVREPTLEDVFFDLTGQRLEDGPA